MAEHDDETAQPGLTDAERDSIVCEIAGDYDNPGLWLAIERVVRRREIEATANTLAVAGVLLGKVADYWDGRPLTHHGDHIYADLVDVLRAVRADEQHNLDRLAPKAGDVWNDSVAPGGYVCSECGMPTESEPCSKHQSGRDGECRYHAHTIAGECVSGYDDRDDMSSTPGHPTSPEAAS